MSNDGHTLILEFHPQSKKFALGFEAGRIWTLLREYPASEITETVHAENSEMFLRMSEATNRPVQSKDISDTHIEITFRPSRDSGWESRER